MKKIIIRFIGLILTALMLLSVLGCGAEKESETITLGGGISSGVVNSNEVKLSAVDLMADIKPDDSITLTKVDAKHLPTDFAVNLFKACFEGEKNTLISPLSVMSALAMTSNGAVGDTKKEMEDVLGMDTDTLNSFMLSYVNSLPKGEKYKLSLANSIWFTDDARFTVNRDFLQTNANYYGAGAYKAPFNKKTCDDINKWVEAKTDGMVKNILDEIPADAVMYLVNALAFDAEWAEKYEEPSQVFTDSFTNSDQTKTDVEYLRCTVSDFIKDDTATGFVKYYAGRKYAFVGLLPNEGISISEYISSMTGEKTAKMLSARKTNKTVYTVMPKFESEYDCEMSDILEKMGMEKAFDGQQADFSALGTSTYGNIYIGRVLHKTFISVGEKGTKAGAATVVEMKDECAAEITGDKPEYVTLNRPFVYMLIDCESNTPFFMGTMLNMGK